MTVVVCRVAPQDEIRFYFSPDTRSVFTIPLQAIGQAQGSASFYYVQSPIFLDKTLTKSIPDEYIGFEFTIHNINGSVLPYNDEMFLYTKTGNLTAFSNQEDVFFQTNSSNVYNISEAQGQFEGKSYVIVTVDSNDLRTVAIV